MTRLGPQFSSPVHPQDQQAMTIDQFQDDLRLVAGNASDLVSCLAAVGNTISVTETAVSG
jgi:hypothetical protein